MAWLPAGVFSQSAEIRPAPLVVMPGEVDSNSPAFWLDGQLHLMNSTGNGPVISRGTAQFLLSRPKPVTFVRRSQWPAWIESTWVDMNGTVFGWYHLEQEGVCGGKRPTQPQIGAAISYNDGETFWDLGIILASAYAPDCSSQNEYFTGGHGDFSVILDRNQEYFYFLFTNYGGPVETQGVAVARMAVGDRFNPVGRVRKYHEGTWTQPGVTGHVTPMLPATVSWQNADTDSFWGPSVHWNAYLESYVMLLNRSCCWPGFPQEGIYLSFNPDLGSPTGWTEPQKVLDDPGWYPQVLGTGLGETDTEAGRVARLYVYGQSRARIVFQRAPRAPAPVE